MMTTAPKIVCIGIIGKHDNPLHISIFPPYATPPSPNSSPSDPLSMLSSSPQSTAISTPTPTANTYLEFSFLLNASLDIFEERARDRNRIDQDLGLLQRIDERLAIWGWETGTGTRFAIVVDYGVGPGVIGVGAGAGEGGGGVKGAFRSLQMAYIRLLQNPFYNPDEHTPVAAKGKGGEITSKKFIAEVRRIGETWKPGMAMV